ncbi:hypothetical protein FAGAP_627 [Fusarium agapanthi]|uniref:DUF6604 domain-containing protein n=1 Tax=Fusarium agapanthi TaxID=1803897 RepID=A0A9P5BL08_9HYPO|nr:hypothetical protein FAGAP_627 [Fusarium agapanthi]
MPTDTPSYDSIEDLTNRFSGLKVYEPSQEFLDAPDIVRPQKAQDDENTYEGEPQNTLEDAMIACAVMLDDLTHIRSQIESLWENYKDGFYDLATAAVVTNTGFDLARNLMESILPIFEPHRGGACAVSEKFSIVLAMMKGFSMMEVKTWGPKGGIENMYDIADDTFLNVHILLNALVAVLGPRKFPTYKEGMFGTYDPNSDRSRKNGHQKFNEDQIILSEYFTEAVTLARAVPNYPVKDEFIRGIRELDKTDMTPFYLVFATQILLDVHQILRADDASDLKKQKQKQKKKATDGGKLKAGAHLKPLAMALTAEMSEFSFPYLVLHRWSWKFLRQIKSVCDLVLRRLYGPTYLDQEKQLPFTVGYILMTFAEDPDGDGKELMRIAAGEFNGLVCQKGIGNVAITAAGKMYGLEFEDDDDDSDSSELPDLE